MFHINHKKGYWLCQGIGWSLFFIFSVILRTIIITDFSALVIFNQVIVTLTMFLLTHLHHHWIKKKEIFLKTRRKTVGYILISNFILALISQLILMPVLFLWIKQSEDYNLSLGVINFVNSYTILLWWSILYFGIKFIQQQRDIERKQWALKAKLKDEQLHRLQEQINPHFMFNALNNIRSLIEEDPEKSRAAITKLSSLLRASLQYESQQLIPLELEVQLVKDYLDLEKVHLEERLQVQWNIAIAMQQIKIPAMSLQVLVENAIKYGISNSNKRETLTIHISQNNTFVVIHVLNPGDLSMSSASGNGLGLENIRQRLKRLLGETASLCLNEKNGNVIAEMKWENPSVQKLKTAAP